jgi:PKD repeat protein
VTPTNLPTVAITANNTSISVNTEVTFTATASYGVSYQWFVDNVLQNGQNGSTFKTSWSSAKIYQVYCRVVNNGGCGATSSNIISVTVNAVLGKDCDGCKRRLELAQISKSDYPYYAVAEGFCIASYLNSYGYGGISFRMTDTGLKDGTYFQKGQKWKSGGCTGKYYYEFGNR